jgi:phage shock protein E
VIELIKNIFGFGPAVDYAALMKEGATIVDVRSKAEFTAGHIRGAVNIPLDQLNQQVHRLTKKDKPVITCCVSGSRSGMARSLLMRKGFTKVYNGGNWRRLETKI